MAMIMAARTVPTTESLSISGGGPTWIYPLAARALMGVVALGLAAALLLLYHRRRRKGAVAAEAGTVYDGHTAARHVAIIMDGNRRYGRVKYRNELRGHWDGGEKLVDTVRWCMEAGVGALTVYAFSTENWNREQREVDLLMATFCKYAERCEAEAMANNIRVRVLSTEPEKLPPDVAAAIAKMERNTADGRRGVAAATVGGGLGAEGGEAASGAGPSGAGTGAAGTSTTAATTSPSFELNLCVSYGSRGDIAAASRRLARRVQEGSLLPEDITEATVSGALSTAGLPDPDVLIRTSGEYRLSNFLLFESAYAELFFLDKYWPELTKADIFGVLKEYDLKRERRFGR